MKRLLVLLSLAATLRAQTAVYPAAVVTDGQLSVAKNNVQTVLSASIQATDTLIPVYNTTGIVADMLMTIQGEIVFVCSVGVGVVQVGKSSCPNIDGRGFDGTTAQPHSPGVFAAAYIAAWHHNSLRLEVEAIENTLGPNLSHVPGGATPGACGSNAVAIATLAGSPGVTCVVLSLVSSFFQNQGTTTTVLHGNASGNPSFSQVSLTADVTGILPSGNLPAATMYNNVNASPTAYYNYSGGQIRFPESVVGSLPSAASSTGKVFVVTDGTSASDCVAGGGTSAAICRSSGSAWVSIGGGGGGGGSTQYQLSGTNIGSTVGTLNLAPDSTITMAGASNSGTVMTYPVGIATAVVPTRVSAQTWTDFDCPDFSGSGSAQTCTPSTFPVTLTACTAANPTVCTMALTAPPLLVTGSAVTIRGATGTGCSSLNAAWTAGTVSGTSITIPFNATGCTYGASSATITVTGKTLTGLSAGMSINYLPGTSTGGGALSLNVSTLGAASVFQSDGMTNPTTACITAGVPVFLTYDSAGHFRCPPSSASTVTAGALISVTGSAVASNPLDFTVSYLREDFCGMSQGGTLVSSFINFSSRMHWAVGATSQPNYISLKAPCGVQIQTDGTSGHITSIGPASLSPAVNPSSSINWENWAVVSVPSITNTTASFGLNSDCIVSVNNCVAIYGAGGTTNWQLKSCASFTCTTVDTGVAFTAATTYRLYMRVGGSSGTVTACVSTSALVANCGSGEVTVNTNLPNVTASALFTIQANAAITSNFNIYGYAFKGAGF